MAKVKQMYRKEEMVALRDAVRRYKAGEADVNDLAGELHVKFPERTRLGLWRKVYQVAAGKKNHYRKPRGKVARIGTDGRKITPEGLRKMSDTAKRNNEVRLQRMAARIRATFPGATDKEVDSILNPKSPRLQESQVRDLEARLSIAGVVRAVFRVQDDGSVRVEFQEELRPQRTPLPGNEIQNGVHKQVPYPVSDLVDAEV